MAITVTQAVPHLTTALTGPLKIIESLMLDGQSKIESWFRSQWRRTPAPFYASVDLRNAGFKIAPVDTNLFPGGFNNLNPAFEPLCVQALQQAIEKLDTPVDRVLIIPENHTRNAHYLKNIAVLGRILERAGFEVKVGSLLDDVDETLTIQLDDVAISLSPLERHGDRLLADGLDAELILLNNDLASGIPDNLHGLAQLVTPPLNLGWSDRLKSVHFGFYRGIANEFAAMLDMDPWLVDPMFRNCGEVDFMKRKGEACLLRNVDALISAIQKKYDEYEVNSEPFVIIKADAGTYGMGVMTVHNADEVQELNRKQRTKMATTKAGQKVTKAIIQEGIYTHETWGGANMVAEPVVYMIDHNVVGGFYRVHPRRARDENLNSPGMYFERLAFDACCNAPDKAQSPDAHPNRFYTYGVIARLALLAAARESARLA